MEKKSANSLGTKGCKAQASKHSKIQAGHTKGDNLDKNKGTRLIVVEYSKTIEKAVYNIAWIWHIQSLCRLL
jgi:hypothetical protein